MKETKTQFLHRIALENKYLYFWILWLVAIIVAASLFYKALPAEMSPEEDVTPLLGLGTAAVLILHIASIWVYRRWKDILSGEHFTQSEREISMLFAFFFGLLLLGFGIASVFALSAGSVIMLTYAIVHLYIAVESYDPEMF